MNQPNEWVINAENENDFLKIYQESENVCEVL